MESKVRTYWIENEVGSRLLEKYNWKISKRKLRTIKVALVYISRINGKNKRISFKRRRIDSFKRITKYLQIKVRFEIQKVIEKVKQLKNRQRRWRRFGNCRWGSMSTVLAQYGRKYLRIVINSASKGC